MAASPGDIKPTEVRVASPAQPAQEFPSATKKHPNGTRNTGSHAHTHTQTQRDEQMVLQSRSRTTKP